MTEIALHYFDRDSKRACDDLAEIVNHFLGEDLELLAIQASPPPADEWVIEVSLAAGLKMRFCAKSKDEARDLTRKMCVKMRELSGPLRDAKGC